MRAFLLRLLAFLLIQTGLFALILAATNLRSEQNYLAATLEKHARLENASSPRLILVGGSNLAFGVDSEALGKAIGREVVNMGLVGGLGLDFMLNEVAPAVRAGDLVVLSLEYDLFSGGFNPVNQRQIIEYRPASVRYVPWRHWRRVLVRDGFTILGGLLRRDLASWSPPAAPAAEAEEVYRRAGFNRWGDLTNHYGRASRLTNGMAMVCRPQWIPEARVLSSLRHFSSLCARRGAAFAFACPPQPDEGLQRREVLDAILGKLAIINGLNLLDAPRDQRYPASYFYDTGYHLLEPGVALRTQKLIREIQRLTSETPAGPGR